MKFKFAMLIILCFAFPLPAQDIASLSFIHSLVEKENATVGDLVYFFMITLNKKSENFSSDIKVLYKEGVIDKIDYKKDELLKRGLLAKMIAKELHLRGSLFYLIFRTERYAIKACAAERIMNSDGSKWDKISGRGLIEAMSFLHRESET